MKYDTTLLIKIDRKTKQKMQSAKLNWSEAIREFIQDRLDRRSRLAEATASMNRLRRISETKTKGKKFDSTAFIRKMRNSRYGPNSA